MKIKQSFVLATLLWSASFVAHGSDTLAKKRVLIIGSKAISQNHVKAVLNSKEAELVGVFSRSAKDANSPENIAFQKIGSEFHTTVNMFHGSSDNLKALLADQKVDLVINASSTSSHADMIETLAEAGVATISEKPFTVSREEAQRAIRTARAKDVFVSDGLMYMHRSWWNQLAKRLADPQIGNLIEIHGVYKTNIINFTNKEESRGGIYNLGVYPLSAVLRVKNMYAQARGLSLTLNNLEAAGEIDPKKYAGSEDPEAAKLSGVFHSSRHQPILVTVDTDPAAPKEKKQSSIQLVFDNGNTLTIDPAFSAEAKNINLVLRDKSGQELWTDKFDYPITAYQQQLEDTIFWIRSGLTKPAVGSGLEHQHTLEVVSLCEKWYQLVERSYVK